MSSYLDEILGLGYSGYAIVQGTPILLLPSSPTENENQRKAEGAYSTDPARASGPLPVRHRRSLNLNLTTPLNPASIPLIKSLTYGWRNFLTADLVSEVPLRAIISNGEGYEGSGYLDELSLQVSASNDAPPTISMSFTLWVWNDLYNIQPTPKAQRILDPFSPDYKLIPSWQTIPTFTGIENSIATDWSLSLANNWTYQPFLGGYLEPPNPGLIYPGPLDCKLNITWFAKKASRPPDVTAAVLKLGTNPTISTINIDRLVRDPQRAATGWGSINEIVKWTATYYATENVPY
jgi:hypothetical protein